LQIQRILSGEPKLRKCCTGTVMGYAVVRASGSFLHIAVVVPTGNYVQALVVSYPKAPDHLDQMTKQVVASHRNNS
jgi:hypothetical protein